MRLAILGIWLCALAQASAQQQERKLVDRLLQPDTSLVNASQGKTFEAGHSEQARTIASSSFYVPDRQLAKNFVATGTVSTKSFPTSSLPAKRASLPTDIKGQTYAINSSPRDEPVAREASKRSTIREKFSGTRPFLVQGKSQKSLQRRNPPLTIDQVRELLNKNK